MSQAWLRVLAFLTGFLSGGFICTAIALLRYWGNWGKEGGLGVDLFMGAMLAVIFLLMNHTEA